MGQATRVGWLPARTSRGRSFCGGHWACHARSHWACHACTHARTPTQGVLTVTTGGLRSLTCSAHVALQGGGGHTTTCPLPSSAVGVCFWFSASALCSHFVPIVPPNPPTWEPCSSQIRVRNTCACGEKRRCRDLNPEQTVGILTIRFSPRSRDAATMCVLPAVRRLPPLTLAAFCFENRSLFGVHICVGMQAGIGGVNPSDSHSTDTA